MYPNLEATISWRNEGAIRYLPHIFYIFSKPIGLRPEKGAMLVRATVVVNGTAGMAECRKHLHRQAEQLGLTGRFEEQGDGRINIVVEGEKDSVNVFISALNTGQCLYHFSGFEIEFKNPEGRLGPFTAAGT